MYSTVIVIRITSTVDCILYPGYRIVVLCTTILYPIYPVSWAWDFFGATIKYFPEKAQKWPIPDPEKAQKWPNPDPEKAKMGVRSFMEQCGVGVGRLR